MARLRDFRGGGRFRRRRRRRHRRRPRPRGGQRTRREYRKIGMRRCDVVSRASVIARALQPARAGTNVRAPPSLIGISDRKSPVRRGLRH